jgi:hypothetical protein
MRYRQQSTLNSFFFNSNRLNIESCFDIKNKQEETDAKTEPTDVNTNIDKDDEADLLDLE